MFGWVAGMLFTVTPVTPAIAADAGKRLSKKELKALVATAQTPADHQKLALHYRAEASRLAAESKEHEELAAAYAKSPSAHDVKHPNSPPTASHCRTLAASYAKAAKDAEAIALAHEQLEK